MDEKSDYYRGKSIIPPMKKGRPSCFTFGIVFFVTILGVTCSLLIIYAIYGPALIQALIKK